MAFFQYEKSAKNIEYYEILENLMERWEYETVEFKEAKSSYDTDKIGRYFSAIRKGTLFSLAIDGKSGKSFEL